MTLDELIAELQIAHSLHSGDEIGYEIYKDSIEILIGENPDTGSSVTIKKPDWC